MTTAEVSRNGHGAGERGEMRIVHDIPGRLRVRLPADARSTGLAEAISGIEGIDRSTWSPQTRSLLVLYRPDTVEAAAILDAIGRHAEIDAESVRPVPAHRPTPAPGRPTFAAAVIETVAELNQRVRRTTRGAVGLNELVPLALVVWALREVALGRAAPLVWSSALWYAHGLFRDYNAPAVEA
jgi:hypothetical protein